MDKEQITIRFLDGEEKKYTKDYDIIMQELKKIDNKIWNLYSFETGLLINETNIEEQDKLRAAKTVNIPQCFESHQQVKQLKEQIQQLQIQLLAYEEKVETLEKLKDHFPSEVLQKNDLKKNVEHLNKQIKQLQKEKESYQNERQLQTESLEINRNKNIELENKLGNFKSENRQISNKIEEQSKEIQQLKQEKLKSEEKITELELRSQRQSRELEILRSSPNIISNKGSESQQALQYDKNDQSNNFSADEKKQERVISDESHQVKFLESYVEKKCDDNNESRSRSIKTCESSSQNIKSSQDIFLITVIQDQFNQSINQNQCFFRKFCIHKQIVYNQYLDSSNNTASIQIFMNGESKTIEHYVFQQYKSESDALDIILNSLLIEKYFELFQRDLQKTKSQSSKFEIFNLKFPKQFLIKDNKDNFSIYQESIGNKGERVFKPFEKANNIDQFISSFFKYFYYSTNQNFALTECHLVEGSVQKDYFLFNIAIHSKYEKGFSLLDEGKTRIQEFEEKSKAPAGTIQIHWSDELQRLAQEVWFGQII